MFLRPLRFGLLAVVLIAAFAAATATAARPDFGADQWKPKKPGAGLQVGVESGALTANYIRAEMQLKHESPIVAPSAAGSAYSFSIVAETDTGFFIRMGYVVLQSDGGLARWFIQILDASGSEKYWKLSRAGEANPPPASSCSSGDGTCDGYPFSLGTSKRDNWQFWFDWISKANVRVNGSGSRIVRVYYLGEVSHAGQLMGPRTALTTYRVTTGATWDRPGAKAFYAGGATCADYGVDFAGTTTRADGQTYNSTAAGSGVGCAYPSTGDTLW